jgi:hypothetical protein
MSSRTIGLPPLRRLQPVAYSAVGFPGPLPIMLAGNLRVETR